MSTLPINTRLQNGAFASEKVLGRGGFGIVYLSGEVELRRSVAIKEFPLNAASEKTTPFIQLRSAPRSTPAPGRKIK